MANYLDIQYPTSSGKGKTKSLENTHTKVIIYQSISAYGFWKSFFTFPYYNSLLSFYSPITSQLKMMMIMKMKMTKLKIRISWTILIVPNSIPNLREFIELIQISTKILANRWIVFLGIIWWWENTAGIATANFEDF